MGGPNLRLCRRPPRRARPLPLTKDSSPMRAPRALRTAFVAAGVATAVGLSASGALALSGPAQGSATHIAAAEAVAHSKARSKRVFGRTVKLADKVSRAK